MKNSIQYKYEGGDDDESEGDRIIRRINAENKAREQMLANETPE